MGEAFKRKRAAAFDHQNHRHYQALIDSDLLRMARTEETRCEVTCPLTNTGTGLSVGSECLLVQNDNGDCDVVHGNVVVGRLPPEAKSAIAACQLAAPTFHGIFPCRVSQLGAFGMASFHLSAESSSGA